ncbi:hypothetical protein AAC387_Pa07g2065 [Persea americana]
MLSSSSSFLSFSECFPFSSELPRNHAKILLGHFLAKFCHFVDDDLFFPTFVGASSRMNKGKSPATDAHRRSTRSSNAAVQQAWEKVQYVERNLEECDSLNRDERDND